MDENQATKLLSSLHSSLPGKLAFSKNEEWLGATRSQAVSYFTVNQIHQFQEYMFKELDVSLTFVLDFMVRISKDASAYAKLNPIPTNLREVYFRGIGSFYITKCINNPIIFLIYSENDSYFQVNWSDYSKKWSISNRGSITGSYETFDGVISFILSFHNKEE